MDYIYWTFSAAAQSISAFIAFLLTGYALVQNLMEKTKDKDDTLEEINTKLRKKYHKQLSALSLLTGIAIVSSLLVVFYNRAGSDFPICVIVIVGIIDFLSIAGGLSFVISIINPDKYTKEAQREFNENVSIDTNTPTNEFFHSFIQLEELIRNYIVDNNLYISSQFTQNNNYSFRQMVEFLNSKEIIDSSLYNELIKISRYRNLVFHGQIKKVDKSIVQDTINSTENITKLLKKKKKSSIKTKK